MPTETREVRFTEIKVEIREHVDKTGDSIGTITGYAAKFDSLSLDLGGFKETIAQGAFKRALAEQQDVRGLVDHNTSLILSRTASGTLTLEEDDVGLKYSMAVPNTNAGRDTLTSLRRGDITGSSFAFEVIKDQWRTEDGEEIRELLDVNLFDVSVVSVPAYPSTVAEASLRALQARLRPNLERVRARLTVARQYIPVASDD